MSENTKAQATETRPKTHSHKGQPEVTVLPATHPKAKPASADKAKAPKPPAQPKAAPRTCPCCGGATKSVFVPGHDARTQKLLKAHNENAKDNPLPVGLEVVFPVWLAHPHKAIKDVVLHATF